MTDNRHAARRGVSVAQGKESPLENPSQTSITMFAGHMVLEGVEERARTTCNQARKHAIQR
ncbi:hypothetical protein, partial [Xanthomonas oryzae]|uniref:hypothetical protein n=1 Tax=Xanthomonas oryzae TaxID=347 RepID=UPI001C9C292D